MPRQGLNATLSYKRGSTTRQYKVRVNSISHGHQMIYDESQARLRRAFYPHRVTTRRFFIGVVLKGYEERRSFTNWMSSYLGYALNPDLATNADPTMFISVPSYEFTHRGIPLSGYEWGDHVGSMIFNPVLAFEAAYEPWDKSKPAVTRVDNTWQAFSSDKAIQHFYPFGTQLSGDDVPRDYDKVVYPGDPNRFNDGYYGGDDEVKPPNIVPPQRPPGVLP